MIEARKDSSMPPTSTTRLDTVAQYLNEIGAAPLLNAQEERELAQVIEAGLEARARLEAGERGRETRKAIRDAAAAKDRFIRSNLRLVVSVARRYPLPPGMELLDLIQEGNIGLEHAVDKFDWRKGFKFSTYATYWIRQAIGRAVDQKSNLIRLPSHVASDLRGALRQADSDGDLDDETLRLRKLTALASLDRPVDDDGDLAFGDLIACDAPGPEDLVVDIDTAGRAADLLDLLDARSRVVLEMRFGLVDGEPRSFREIGEALGLTPENARRVMSNALRALRSVATYDGVEVDLIAV